MRIMKMLHPIVVLTCFLAAACPALAQDFLAEGRNGKILCLQVGPGKECVSVATYRFGAKGAIVETSETVAALNPLAVVRGEDDFIDDGDNRCRATELSKVQKLQYFSNGIPLVGTELESVRTVVVDRMAPYIGKHLCLYVFDTPTGPEVDLRVDKVTLDRPRLGFVWITRSDGYRLLGGANSIILPQ